MERRDFLRTTLGATIGGTLLGVAGARELAAAGYGQGQAALPPMTVYKSPSCGCCKFWVEHAQKAGFTVKTVDSNDMAAVKREMAVPGHLHSCHTVAVGSYVIEGHVPASDVKRLLAQKPKVRGLAAPGMPIGSPGMEQGPPSSWDRYDVIAFGAPDGKQTVFASHGPPKKG
jgi:hypothetical protein